MNYSENLLANFKNDIPAGLVIFLVALPLCLGIALASGTPVSSGIIAGIIGGLLVPLISKSPLSVSGPAAGLTTIVLLGMETIGSFEGLLGAIFLAGFVQMILGVLKLGNIAYFVPSSVIKGMMAGIGFILILKQIPHAIGYDTGSFEIDEFIISDENTFTLLFSLLTNLKWGALIISVFSIFLIAIWNKTKLAKLKWLPSALIITLGGVFINLFFKIFIPELYLSGNSLVYIPQGTNPYFSFNLVSPDWSQILNPNVLKISLTIGIVASLESLLTVEAVDKMDPLKRKSPLNRELIAQGMANCMSGLIGGIPITSVVVRSSVNINSGGKTKMAALAHGVFLVIAILYFIDYINMIPLASLASILLTVGYKLVEPKILKKIKNEGYAQFAPAVVTTLTILFIGLLTGIVVGLLVGLFFVFKTNYHSPMTITREGDEVLISFNKDMSFIHKAIITKTLENLEPGVSVTVDGSKTQFIDYDVMEELREFQIESKNSFVKVKYINIEGLEN